MIVRNLGHSTFVVEARGLRVIVDPWLTHRLDRFWEHHPPLRDDAVPQRVDVILLSHHHYDHCHPPSLFSLNRDCVVLHPATKPTRAVTNPGAGTLAIPWLLQRLGFAQVSALEPFAEAQLGPLTIRAVPSGVSFPELAYLISDGECHVFLGGDTVPPPNLTAWLARHELRPQLAILPVHSVAADACFRGRNLTDDVVALRAAAAARFQHYIKQLPGTAIIPGAFGWRVTGDPPPLEPSCDWMNRRLFPLTVVDGFQLAQQTGAEAHLSGPGDSIALEPDGIDEAGGPHWDQPAKAERQCAIFRIETLAMPPFDGDAFGPALADEEREQVITFVERELPDRLKGTPFFMRAIEERRRVSLRIACRQELAWTFDFASGGTPRRGHDKGEAVQIAGRIFHRMMRAELPWGHAFGAWVGDPALLDAVFSDPRLYLRYLERLLATPEGLGRYGF